MKHPHYSLFVLSIILGSAVSYGALAQGQESTYTYTERVTRVEPATGASESHSHSATTTTRIANGTHIAETSISPNYDHTYYTYSEKYQAPVLHYGGIEEPVIVDNGETLTPIRTLAE